MFKACVIIPVYDHEHAIGMVVEAVLKTGVHCILVDDGSHPPCQRELERLTAAAPQQISLLRHAVNSGKGSAVLSGFRHADAQGFTHALQIDADGQHNVDDLGRFLQIAEAHPDLLVIGCPIYDETVPPLRLYARYLTHASVWINTLSLEIRDSMCGFRVYPLAPLIRLMASRRLGERMDFDTEVLVRLHWEGHHVINVPTRVRYPTDGVSHFRMVLDNVLLTRLHGTLFLGMLWRLPRLLPRLLARRRSLA